MFLIQINKQDRVNRAIFAAILALSITVGNVSPFIAVAEEAPVEEQAVEDTTLGESGVPGEPGEGALIETGDAVAVGEADNSVNTNTTTDNSGDTALTDDNDANVENDAAIDAATGENTAEGDGDNLIDTGNAVSAANVVNVVNTNIFNSNGFILLLNALFGWDGDLDFRVLDQDFTSLDLGTSSIGCELDECGAGNLQVANDNVATITNDVVVRARTGNNAINGGEGDGTIATGHAYAAANVVNLANTNIVNSNYALVVFNNFDSWAGDIVLPGSNSSFWQNWFGGNFLGGAVDIQDNNLASVENNATTTAATGDNSAAANEGAAIDTGNGLAAANVVNHVNENLIGGNSIVMVFRVFGDWTGGVLGAPEGVLWEETPDGLKIFSENGGTGGGNVGGSGALKVANTNVANIANNVHVIALTGENMINTATGTANIATGDAAAIANIVNIANTNVVGRNWIMAFINIFGNWGGNIAFGRPDLWIGSRAETETDPLYQGSDVVYHFTVVNNGDSPATDVKIHNWFDPIKFEFLSAGNPIGPLGDEMVWNLGDIPAGGSVEVSYRGRVRDSLPEDESEIVNTATVTSGEADDNNSDNTDVLALLAIASKTEGGSGGARIEMTDAPNLVLEKSNNAALVGGFSELAETETGDYGKVNRGDTVEYKLVLKNESDGPAYRATLRDHIEDPDGNIIYENEWFLDTIFPHEEITVTYEVTYNHSAQPGIYMNYAEVEAIGGHPSVNPFYGYYANSNVAESGIAMIEGDTAGIGPGGNPISTDEADGSSDGSAEDTTDSAGAPETDEPDIDYVSPAVIETNISPTSGRVDGSDIAWVNEANASVIRFAREVGNLGIESIDSRVNLLAFGLGALPGLPFWLTLTAFLMLLTLKTFRDHWDARPKKKPVWIRRSWWK